MPIRLVCPGCQVSLSARPEHAGRHVRCPECALVQVGPANLRGVAQAIPVGRPTGAR
jgi:hypothetical protein